MKKKNLFIFSSEKRHKKYLSFAFVFFGLYWACFLLLVCKPSIFYWRAWEYFDEVGWLVPGKTKWEGYEYGNEARNYLYSFQDKWKTTVTCDEEGFRSVPIQADKYPIVVVGDSHTWGTALSDDETIPWQMAQKLSMPVFNAGRRPFTLCYLINNPRLKEAKIIVELITEHIVQKSIFNHPDMDGTRFDTKDYVIYAKEKSYCNYFKIHPKRFFLPLKLVNGLNFKRNLKNEMKRFAFDPFLIKPSDHHSVKKSYFKDDLDEIVQRVSERSETLKNLGYIYVLGLVPTKLDYLCYHEDPLDCQTESLFAQKLSEKGVHYIDSCAVFRKHKNRRLLYFRTDCHSNEVAAEIIAELAATYLKEKFPEICNDI